MREIKFRGKRIDNGEWVYGYVINFPQTQETLIGYFYAKNDNFLADPATVGQYTGLKDKNGKEIYEGDIVNRRSGEYWQGCYEFDDTITISDLMDIVTTAEFESLLVIGNVHDDPNLLGVTE